MGKHPLIYDRLHLTYAANLCIDSECAARAGKPWQYGPSMRQISNEHLFTDRVPLRAIAPSTVDVPLPYLQSIQALDLRQNVWRTIQQLDQGLKTVGGSEGRSSGSDRRSKRGTVGADSYVARVPVASLLDLGSNAQPHPAECWQR
jgi:hypothetical protein